MSKNSTRNGKRAVLMVCDGLRRDLIDEEIAPTLSALGAQGAATPDYSGAWRSYARHRGVFPSVTRVTSASISTGCLPGRHGLHGNTMVLDDGGVLECRNAGEPDFRDRMRRATGATLRSPTLAERLVDHGGGIVFSNVSPGAAYFQDPDGHGHVYHSSGSFAPGLKPLPRAEWLNIEKGNSGDKAMTARFCEEVLRIRRPALSTIWLSEPDHSGHHWPLGSPEHRAAITGADACVAKVVETLESQDPEWQRTLMIVCSDHGHESVHSMISIEAALVEAGLKAGPDSNDVVVAPNGTAALIYLSEGAMPRCAELAAFLRQQEWVCSVYAGEALQEVGLRPEISLALAIDMAKLEQVNAYGVKGYSYMAQDRNGSKDYTGLGQHGGLGENEQRPFMIARGEGLAQSAQAPRATSPVDIAPTILQFLGLSGADMDGAALYED